MIAWPNRKLVYACVPIFILFVLSYAGVQQPVCQNYSNRISGNFSFSYNHLPPKNSCIVTNGNTYRIVTIAPNTVEKSAIIITTIVVAGMSNNVPSGNVMSAEC